MKTIRPADVVLFEGILVLYDQNIRELMHMKLFVDTDSDTRLARRGETPMCTDTNGQNALVIFLLLHGSVCRDIEERGRDLEQVLKQYINLVKPAFEEFTLPVRW